MISESYTKKSFDCNKQPTDVLMMAKLSEQHPCFQRIFPLHHKQGVRFEGN